MKKYLVLVRDGIDNRTLQLLNAQVNLTETFNHVLRTAPKRECLAFRLKAERGAVESTFVVELGSERHTLTLPNEKKMHLKLADFILSEEVQSAVLSELGGFPGVAWDYVNQDLRTKYADVIPTTIPSFPGGDWEKAINDGWYRNVAPNVDRNA